MILCAGSTPKVALISDAEITFPLQAWLRSLLLDDNLTEKLELMGAFELADLADIDDR